MQQALVRRELIPKGDLLVDLLRLKCGHGDVERFLFALVEVIVSPRVKK